MDTNIMKSAFDSFGDVEFTTDHKMIRRWVSAHRGHPARLSDARTAPPAERGPLELRIRFPRMPERESRLLVDISWDEFFQAFEAELLAMEFVNGPSQGRTFPMVRFVRRAIVGADDAALSDPAVYRPES